MKELIIIKKQREQEIAYLENGILEEYYVEREDKKRLEGNIYAGKVINVLEGMQAAFVDIGEGKNTFLHIRDVIPKKSNLTGNKEENFEKYAIKDYIKRNQMILVQVKKDSNNIKGARISTDIQIPARFIVILPENDFITTSQKIENNEEKNRLTEIIKNIKKDKKVGVIIRTAAEGKTKEDLEKDFANAWKKLEAVKSKYEKVKKANKPTIIKKNDTILEKILLDLSVNKLDKIWVNTAMLQNKVEGILNNMENNGNIKVECQNKELENKHELAKQIEKLENRKIWLKCGGFITIDKTEALTAIDVNSGKYTGKENLEKTVLKVNKEASIEIAKQIRLRDIGGIIVIDYIDMNEESSKKEIIQTLRQALKQDRAKTQLMEFTKLNLLEMTRKHMFSGE